MLCFERGVVVAVLVRPAVLRRGVTYSCGILTLSTTPPHLRVRQEVLHCAVLDEDVDDVLGLVLGQAVADHDVVILRGDAGLHGHQGISAVPESSTQHQLYYSESVKSLALMIFI